MDTNPEGEIIRDVRAYAFREKSIALLLVTGVLLSLLAAWYLWPLKRDSGVAELESYGLSTTPVPSIKPTGILYFSAALKTSNELTIPNLFKYDFNERLQSNKNTTATHSFASGNQEFNAAIAFIASSTDPDGYQPAWINTVTGEVGPLPAVEGFEETDLTVSSDNQFYAYSFRTVAGGDLSNLDEWNVAIHNYSTNELTVFETAAEPEFINGSEAVVFMTKGGLFKYTLSSKETTPLYTLYQNLEMYDDFAIASDATKIVLTLQRLNLISVAQPTLGATTFDEINAIRNVSSRYRSPVLSPDNQLYAVTAALANDFDENSQTYSTINAEVRTIDGSSVIDVVTFEGVVPASITLENWGV